MDREEDDVAQSNAGGSTPMTRPVMKIVSGPDDFGTVRG